MNKKFKNKIIKKGTIGEREKGKEKRYEKRGEKERRESTSVNSKQAFLYYIKKLNILFAIIHTRDINKVLNLILWNLRHIIKKLPICTISYNIKKIS